MNHLKSIPQLIALFLFFAGANPAYGQTYETDFGWDDSHETPWDGIWPVTDRPVTLMNSDRTGLTSAVLTFNRNLDGEGLQATFIYKDGYRLEGRSLGSTNFIPSGGYHMTGFWTKNQILSPATAFLLKTNWACQPQKCVKKVTNGFSELGMVVEETNKDVLVAGNGTPQIMLQPFPAPPLRAPGRFWAARFDGNMSKVWAFDYLSLDTAQFVIHEGCMGVYLAKDNEKRPGLALTGYYIKKGEKTRHTFVSMIDYQTGQEVWRTPCRTFGIAISEGFDLVQDTESLLFFVVGYARKSVDGVKKMFTAVVNPSGSYLGGAYHEIPPNWNVREMVARDVCLSIKTGYAVATGYAGLPDAKAFAVELKISVPAPANWAAYYELSYPDLRGSESIVSFKGNNNFTPGYFITTGGRLYHVPAGTKDAQVIKIRPDGLFDICPAKELRLDPQPLEPLKPPLKFRQDRSVWKRDKVKSNFDLLESTKCDE